jgi:hypothetical protein
MTGFPKKNANSRLAFPDRAPILERAWRDNQSRVEDPPWRNRKGGESPW